MPCLNVENIIVVNNQFSVTKTQTIPVLAQTHTPSNLAPNPVDSAIAHTNAGSNTDETTAANNATANDMTLMQAAPVVGDGYFIGLASIAGLTLVGLRFNVGTAGAGTLVITPQYWNGASFVTLPFSLSQINNWQTSGIIFLDFVPPADWATSTILTYTHYFIKLALTSYTSQSVQAKGTQAWNCH
jgi:hypothetical protein